MATRALVAPKFLWSSTLHKNGFWIMQCLWVNYAENNPSNSPQDFNTMPGYEDCGLSMGNQF